MLFSSDVLPKCALTKLSALPCTILRDTQSGGGDKFRLRVNIQNIPKRIQELFILIRQCDLLEEI